MAYKLKHETCACCGGAKEYRKYQYCENCRERIQRITETMPISNKVDLVRIDLEALNKAKEQAAETIKKMEEKQKVNCPCKPWGLGKSGCMFSHCVAVDGFREGRTV